MSGPLTPAVFHILLALVDGPLHGYAIMQAVEESGGPGPRAGPDLRLAGTGGGPRLCSRDPLSGRQPAAPVHVAAGGTPRPGVRVAADPAPRTSGPCQAAPHRG